MSWTRLAATLALALSPLSLGVAQETQETLPPPAEDRPEQNGESATQGERQAPPARDDSPYDYQASEEISEDLSVSFPVDI
jgi:hypothetical protein